MPVYSGWGEVPWGEGTWGLDLTYYQTSGVSASGAVGTCNFLVTKQVNGEHGTGEIGGFIVQVDDIVVPDTDNLEGIGAVGTPFIYVFKQVTVTGVDATASVTNAAYVIAKTLTGVEATGAVQDVAIQTDDVVIPPSVQGTGTVGDVDARWVYDRTVYLDGWGSINWGGGGWGNGSISVQGSGNVGTVTFAVNETIIPDGVQASGAVGTVAVEVDDSFIVNGVEGTGAIGTCTPFVNYVPSGEHGTGEIGGFFVQVDDIFVPDTIALEGNGAVGTVFIYVFKQVSVIGVEGTGAVGDETPLVTTTAVGVQGTGAVQDITPLVTTTGVGVEGTGTVNTVAIATAFAPAGVVGTGAVGDEIPQVSIVLPSVQATAAVGQVTPQYDETVIPTGIQGTGAVEAPDNYVVTITLPSVSASAVLGQIELDVDDSVTPNGVAGTGAVGVVFISGWTQINDAQVANWEEIDIAA